VATITKTFNVTTNSLGTNQKRGDTKTQKKPNKKNIFNHQNYFLFAQNIFGPNHRAAEIRRTILVANFKELKGV